MMLTAREVATEWMSAHTPADWRKLLDEYERVPVLGVELDGWLRAKVAGYREYMATIYAADGLDGAKALARFEDAFIANVSRALDAV